MSRTMTRTQSISGPFWMALSVAGVLTALIVFGATAADAGGCPKDQVTTTDGQANGSKGTKDGTDELLGQIDLSKEQVKVPGRLFRFRRLVIEPGGEVPWHNHGDRPALIYVISGNITEYSSHCKAPIEHKAGDLSMESGGLSHWWKNASKEPAVLVAADLAKNPDDDGM
jgi:quercetin dioxygenase-like cupin family protein